MTHPMIKYSLVSVPFLLVLAALLAIALRVSTNTSRVFRQYVCDPVPKSVQHVKVHRRWELSGHRYVMHFEIDPNDLSSILDSRQFKEVSKVRYRDGSLCWDLDSSHSEELWLYPPSHGGLAPDWFRPNDWNSPKAYRYKERQPNYRQHMQVLVYNDERGEAYFIEYQE